MTKRDVLAVILVSAILVWGTRMRLITFFFCMGLIFWFLVIEQLVRCVFTTGEPTP